MAADQQAQLASEFVNEYGENLEQMRANIISDTQIIDVMVQGNFRKWMRQSAGVIALKMVSEILLHLGDLTVMRPMLVQKGVLGLIIDMQSAITSQSTSAMTSVREALLNLG